MRIWDISPGYLNRQSLLGEHRELHGIISIIANHKKGYANHPETRRWRGFDWALRQRHRQLAAEMFLRGYREKSPVDTAPAQEGLWPELYLDEPGRQFQLLAAKYREKEAGRIPLPKDAQQLWSQHKYSTLARDVRLYKQIGRDVARVEAVDFAALSKTLAELLRTPPSLGGLRNALQHMWGYVAASPPAEKGEMATWSLDQLLLEIQLRSKSSNHPYLTASTALGELRAWLPKI